jgi:VWFA-related protein
MRLRTTPLTIAVAMTLACTAGGRVDAKERTVPFTAQANSPAIPTIQTRVPLTIVDITVTDAKGNPVHGLQQSDFTVLEDGKPMQPNSFEEHRADRAQPTPTPVAARLDLAPNSFTNFTPTPPGTAPLTVLLLDSLNTPLANQRLLQQHMLDFVGKMPPGTRMAVFNLSEFRLSVLQGFTSDVDLLKAAINSKKVTGQVPPVEDLWQDPILNSSLPETLDPEETECNRSALRAQDSLAAMRQLARYLSGMPGRKNLLWFSGSFPLQMDSHATSCYDVTQDMTAADDQLARAHVVVYPADPRAMDAMAMRGCVPPNNIDGGCLPHKAEVVQRQSIEHLTMEAIAEQTGGKAFYNTNALDQIAADAIDNGSNFYTLTYAPTNQTLDTRFRTIKITVDQPNLHLTYRNGYYAIDPATTLAGGKVTQVTPMQAAMMRGSLVPTQVLFRVNVAESPATETAAPASNQPDAKLMHPPFRHYSLAYVIDVHGIDFATSPDGNYRGDFEYGVRVYNADGDEIVNSVAKTVSPILPPAVYRSMLTGGANAHQEIDVPATGDYFLRIAVHDLASGRVGAIEIPTSSITPVPPGNLKTGP